MSRRVSPSTDKVYGPLRVSRLWGVSRATVHRRRRPKDVERRRRGPPGPMSDDALVGAIRRLLAEGPFHGEGHRKLWARLRFAGIRTSRRRVLRLAREHGLLAHQRAGRPHGPRAHDRTITTGRVDLMWGSDMTTTFTDEGQAAVSIAVDHCSAECVGVHAARHGTRPPRGAGAAPPGRAPPLRRLREGRRPRPRRAARPRLTVHGRRLPEGAALPRHRELARLRA